jgi:hypothetical protein
MESLIIEDRKRSRRGRERGNNDSHIERERDSTEKNAERQRESDGGERGNKAREKEIDLPEAERRTIVTASQASEEKPRSQKGLVESQRSEEEEQKNEERKKGFFPFFIH